MPTTRKRRERRGVQYSPVVQALIDGLPIERTEENREEYQHRLLRLVGLS